MYNISDLSNEEIKYICERMHLPSVRSYLQHNIEEFNRIKPGFTVKKMTDAGTLSFLVKYSNKPFIKTLIQNVVEQWLSQIKENLDLLEGNGFSSGEALLKTIPDCYFNEQIELYFKLTEQEYDEKYLDLIKDALSLVNKTSTEATEECNTKIINEQLAESTKKISELNKLLGDSQSNEKTLQKALDDTKNQLQQCHAQIVTSSNELSELRLELERYQMLERYKDDSIDSPQLKLFPFTSIGKVILDYNQLGYWQKWIIRLADISADGSITVFTKNKDLPHYFANRDRLYWNDGPDKENSIGVWNWTATPRDTDPQKDLVKTYYCNNIKLIQIVRLSNCESLDDIAALLKDGLSLQSNCSKFLFVYEDGTFLHGLFCSSTDFNNVNNIITLKSNVFILSHYCINNSDVIEIAGIGIYKFIKLGIPKSVYHICNPYDAVKSLIISRITNASLREYDLSKKEVQRCRQFLKSIPTQTLIQELSLDYNCSKDEAQGFIDGFIEHADSYLAASDFDAAIISRAIRGNSDLIEVCKQQLTDEWKAENSKMIVEAETKQKEIDKLVDEKNKLSTEVEQLQSKLNQREQLASEVETKISLQIEKAKQNAADFISTMAFVSPLSSTVVSYGKQTSNQISVFNSHINCVEDGEIDDIDTFEDELSENLIRIGYDNEQSIEISQAISFGIFEKVPLVISENAKLIAQCLAAVLNGGNVSEVFVPVQGINIEDLSAAINDNLNKVSPMVCLVHGVFDGYSINLFNALSNIMQNWDNVVMLLSLEGTPSKMIMPGVWNRSIFIDGDRGFEKKAVDLLHTFTVLDSLDFHDRTIDMKSKEYKDARKSMKLFTDILSNTQIGMYSRYLAIYNASLDDSNLILTQLIATARSIGNPERLKELFQENGIGSGEELFD